MTHIVREPECYATSGLSNMHRRRLEAAGKFPKRFKLNPDGGLYGAVGWDFDELMEWRAERLASRDSADAIVAARAAKRDDTDADGNDADGDDEDGEENAPA